jgi:hypothetical protein
MRAPKICSQPNCAGLVYGGGRRCPVEHRAHVLHPLLERRDARYGVREAGAALVEHDQPRERRQPASRTRHWL